MVTDHLADLKKWVNDLPRKGNDGEEVQLNRGVRLISQMFHVAEHEVAILGLTEDGLFLRFLAPDTLRAIGQIPLSSGTALAARTMREKKPEIVNHFHNVPHASVFEGVPVSESERGDPIQKIMSSPVMCGGQSIGVVQVSRKGKSSNEAGPDFTTVQLQTLKTISDVLAPCVQLCAQV
jgi:GAF domain-containing protein